MDKIRISERHPRWVALALFVISVILLAGCSASAVPEIFSDDTPATPAPTIAVESTATPQVLSTPESVVTEEFVPQPLANSGSLIYNAEILPESQVPVVAEVAGQILEINVDVSDHVTTGDALAQIDTVLLEAQRAQAEAGLQAAQSQLELAVADPDPADLEAARAAVSAAQAAYNRARQGATEEDRRLVLTQVQQAEAGVNLAQSAYDRIAGQPFSAMMPESLQLQQATYGLEAAQAQYDKVLKGATADVIAGAYAQLAGARSQLARLEQGAKPEQIKAAEAGVIQAETALFMMQTQVDKATVRAPINGIVAQVMSAEGSMAGPGSPVLMLLSEDIKLIFSVEEVRMRDLYVGQPALISVDAYPDRVFEGEVVIIAPALDAATRTIPVTIRPNGDASELRPGMFATVTLQE
ncbi:MAG: HlyD family efflux transporter periplasmic adaptor subunit [Chloroflexi bacterium]|nr:HlyD family efflux transporter periplasmic adaptor subunit [Chloroflexota bacterium]